VKDYGSLQNKMKTSPEEIINPIILYFTGFECVMNYLTQCNAVT